METRQLRYFVEIVERGSFTRAAAHLNVAQPALSLTVKAMESDLGTSLLVRSSSGVTPTEAGALLVARARAILDDIARTEDEIRNLESDPAGLVRIGLPGTISAIVALPLIEAARARFPRIRITVAEAMSGFIAEWLEEGRVDLAILYAPPAQSGMTSEPLLEEELVVIWPGGADRPGETDLAGLRAVPMILPSAAHGLRVQIDNAFKPLGFAPEVAIEIDSYANIKRLVESGHGASILPRHAVRDETGTGALSVSRIADPGLWRAAHLIHPSSRPATRAQQAVRDLLRDVVGDLLQTGRWAAARPPSE
ncbi:MAG: LysR family transcriptional regulator [Pseudooceanicola sp.]